MIQHEGDRPSGVSVVGFAIVYQTARAKVHQVNAVFGGPRMIQEDQMLDPLRKQIREFIMLHGVESLGAMPDEPE